MPRKSVSFSTIFPLHINARTTNRERFKAPLDQVWKVMENNLYLISKIYDLRIYSFVLMPNHFHLLVRPVDNNVGAALNYFMRETSKEIGRKSDRINQVYGGRNYKTLVTSQRHFLIAYKYVYRNPVKAGLCSRVEDYPFSTLNNVVGRSKSFIPVEDDTLLFAPNFTQSTVDWLNKSPSEEENDIVKKALRRSVFKLPLDKNTKKQCRLESEEF